jgi:hypothetical protein
MSAPGPRRGVGNGVVIVCSACETESCWQGVLMCDESLLAGTVVRETPKFCPGGCGCQLGTDDADRFECGCDAGCCDEEPAPREGSG